MIINVFQLLVTAVYILLLGRHVEGPLRRTVVLTGDKEMCINLSKMMKMMEIKKHGMEILCNKCELFI